MMDSRVTSAPSVVFAVVVTCKVGFTLNGCSVDPITWDTDVDDDVPRSLYNGMDGQLREGLAIPEGVRVVTNATCLLVGPKV